MPLWWTAITQVTEVCNRQMELPLYIFITRISCDWLLAFYIAYFIDSYCILPVHSVIPVMITGITRNVQNWSSCCLCLVWRFVRWKMYKLSCINEHLPCASDIKFVLHVTVNDIGLESIIHVILKGGLCTEVQWVVWRSVRGKYSQMYPQNI